VAARKKAMGRNLGALLGGARPRALSKEAPATSAPPPSSIDDSSKEESASVNEVGSTTNAVNRSTAVGIAPINDESDATSVSTFEANVSAPNGQGDRLRMLGIDQIQRGAYQPRRHFDPDLIQELADSLKAQGLIQPILVRPNDTGGFELIAGERRWRAAQVAGLTEIPAIVRPMEDRAVAAVSLIENIQRKDLNPLEEAEALRRLCEEFGLSHQEVADSVGRSRSAVTNLMRLLDLHDEVKTLVDQGEIDMGHARALLGAPYDDQPELARRIAKQGLTVRAVESQIKALRKGKSLGASSREVSDPDIDKLAQHLGERLGASVTIRHLPSGSGKLEIRYNSLAELDGVLSHIK